jgi:hypothetical protein
MQLSGRALAPRKESFWLILMIPNVLNINPRGCQRLKEGRHWEVLFNKFRLLVLQDEGFWRW